MGPIQHAARIRDPGAPRCPLNEVTAVAAVHRVGTPVNFVAIETVNTVIAKTTGDLIKRTSDVNQIVACTNDNGVFPEGRINRIVTVAAIKAVIIVTASQSIAALTADTDYSF